MAALEVVRVPVLSDNYAWLVHDPETGDTVAIDPGEAAPMLAAAAERGWRIGQVWNTHWHPDHTAGNAQLQSEGARVTGPAAEVGRIPTLDAQVAGGDRVRVGAREATVIETPGHTAGHVVFHFAEDALVFTGDTLFAMGCGRLFEGTPAQMFANMRLLEALPDGTQVHCGHEYTRSNARFALSVDPDNPALRERAAAVDAARARGEATIPFPIEAERATNPFMRAESAEELAKLRRLKDNFRG